MSDIVVFVPPLAQGGESDRQPQSPRASSRDILQWYQTSPQLAMRLLGMFDLFDLDRGPILDACAGAGHLTAMLAQAIETAPVSNPGRKLEDYVVDNMRKSARVKAAAMDAIEIDVRHHPILRSKGYRIVGLDVESHESFAKYSLILSNPPFARGARMVLRMWDGLVRGSLGVILNAQTIRNPCTPERQRLVKLLASHGARVEFVADAFASGACERPADVEVALIRLDKTGRDTTDWIDGCIGELAKHEHEHDIPDLPNELALPADFVSTQVLSYQLALKSGREFIRQKQLFDRCKRRVGKPRQIVLGHEPIPHESDAATAHEVAKEMSELEDELLDRAWNSVLRLTSIEKQLSSAAFQELNERYADIRRLAFTAQNVSAFLRGLRESTDELRMNTVLTVFDWLTRYTSDNCVWHMGWRSNDRQAYCGRRLRASRIVLPGFDHIGARGSVTTQCLKGLHDLDLVFALIDQSGDTSGGIVDTFVERVAQLRSGERVASKHFDIRFHPGVGTVHLFPHDQALIDRLNRLVGHHRNWLPPEGPRATPNFWSAYERAERFTKDVREELARRGSNAERRFSRRNSQGADCDQALEEISAVMDAVARKWGIFDAIERERALALNETVSPTSTGQLHTQPQRLSA